LTLDAGATITGRVVGLLPEQLAAVIVTGQDAEHGRAYTSTNVDGHGNFAIRGMAEGRVRIEASVASRQAPSKTVTVQNGVAPIVEINFAEAITVSGRVIRNGMPPPSNGSIFFAPSPPSGNRQTASAVLSAA